MKQTDLQRLNHVIDLVVALAALEWERQGHDIAPEVKAAALSYLASWSGPFADPYKSAFEGDR